MKHKVLITIDHKWRDLPSYVYLGVLLKSRGYKVEYFRNGIERFAISGFQPNTIILNHAYSKERQKYLKYLDSSGVNIILLPTEGIPIIKENLPWYAGVGVDLSSVAVNFYWNKTMQSYVNNHPNLRKKSTKVVGVPRFDFYKEELNSLLMDKKTFCKKYNFPIYEKNIVFATNYTSASFYEKNFAFLKKDIDVLNPPFASEDEEELKKFPKTDLESRSIALDFFLELVKSYPDVGFIIKTHPSEDQTFYHKYFSKKIESYKNRVLIISNEYIWNVLGIADIEISRSCTTAIEAWILEKPTIEIQLHPKELYTSKEHASGSVLVRNFSELHQAIESYLKDPFLEKEIILKRKNFIKKWCFKVDGKSSHRVIDEIVKLPQRPNSLRVNQFHRFVYLTIKLTDFFIHDLKIFKWKIFHKDRQDSLGRKDKFFHYKDIRNWEKRIIQTIQK